MPHFGLMDPDALGPEKAALQRAKLHIRSGKRRLRQNKISLGIVTLYDALSFAMQWYVASPERQKRLHIEKYEDINEVTTLFKILTTSKVLDGTFDFKSFQNLVEVCLDRELLEYDYQKTLQGIESVMVQLGVMPFDEEGLPPEAPNTS
ncbi:MAG: hypothetical protein ACFFBD_11105 [Candidatus Hodarchaeota archaeon]